MSIKLGEIAPDFKAITTEGDINFHEYSWRQLGHTFLTIRLIR